MSFIKRRLAFVFVRLENIQWQQIRWGSMYIKCVILQLLYLECLPELVEQSSLCRFLVISRVLHYGTRFLSTSSYDFGKWNPTWCSWSRSVLRVCSITRNNRWYNPVLKEIPSVFLTILPYVFTILALVGFVGRSEAPKALGTPYEKGKR